MKDRMLRHMDHLFAHVYVLMGAREGSANCIEHGVEGRKRATTEVAVKKPTDTNAI